jgi:hypothetical protein
VAAAAAGSAATTSAQSSAATPAAVAARRGTGTTTPGGTANAGARFPGNGNDRSPFRLRHRGPGGQPSPTPTTLPAGTPDPNCILEVPANPLTAGGLAAPYKLKAADPGGVCSESIADTAAFVQGAIIDNATGQITLYNPLVTGDNEKPAPTVTPTVPANATVALWFGFNGDNLTLQSAKGTDALRQGNCVNGLRGSIFGQFSYCNAPAFFRVANQAIASGALTVPDVGKATTNGKPCPTVRDFSVVDQDQSDNVTTHYLATTDGTIGQQGSGIGGTPLNNGSDNLLLTGKIDPTLGCTPWMVPDQTNGGKDGTSLPLDELQAAAHQADPVALVPLNDPMTQVNGANSVEKTNLYRAGVDQPLIGAGTGGRNGGGFGRGRRTPTVTPTGTAPATTATGTTTTATGTPLAAGLNVGTNGDPAAYCQALFYAPEGIARVIEDQALYAKGPSADTAVGGNLFTFLAGRAAASYTNLGCNKLGVSDPVTLTLDANGVTTAATYNAAPATALVAAPTTSTAASLTSTAPASSTTTMVPLDAPSPSSTSPSPSDTQPVSSDPSPTTS